MPVHLTRYSSWFYWNVSFKAF